MHGLSSADRDYRPILAVTGIQAAGKSTVARLLARRFARGVHIEADLLQRMIVAGGAGVDRPGQPSAEAACQLALRLQNACLLARSFHDAGFAVVLDDIILGDRWDQLESHLAGYPYAVIVLAPSAEVVVRERDGAREKAPLGADWAHYLDGVLRGTMSGAGLWVDSSRQTPDETVEEIARRLGLG